MFAGLTGLFTGQQVRITYYMQCAGPHASGAARVWV